MASEAMDLFALPEVTWEGQQFDCYILMVDRLTSWMMARPSLKLGLTGEKAAHLMLDGRWGELGVPITVTSDQGSKFVSQWWLTICSRLGVRSAFSQAHRPQANGRAEVCGRILQTALRKLHLENRVNWVEALPNAHEHTTTRSMNKVSHHMRWYLDAREIWPASPFNPHIYANLPQIFVPGWRRRTEKSQKC